ncbi:hypothetical protein EAE99_006739 [Botrytis elliptica]|nr:hypothetical protein EAE99_006739 [Botrytis elliptica]
MYTTVDINLHSDLRILGNDVVSQSFFIDVKMIDRQMAETCTSNVSGLLSSSKWILSFNKTGNLMQYQTRKAVKPFSRLRVSPSFISQDCIRESPMRIVIC